MTRTIEPLTAQVAHGQYALAALRDAENMMSLITQWDSLPYSMKLNEADKGQRSRFAEVPGFEPVWCASCVSEVLLDYRQDPEGQCMVCGEWASHNGPDQAAA